MLEKALTGSARYKTWMLFLLVVIGLGFLAYIRQYQTGLTLTGMSRDVSWGIYISQFTFLVGVAASAVMLVLPYYLHDYKTFSKAVIFGEFLAIASVTMCLLFILVDLGQPRRVLNVLLHPTPNSILFWDMIVLNVYLFLNLLCGWVMLEAERKDVPPPKWIKPFVYLSIPWAISIHTVTAFLYAGLPSRHLWLTAIMAPRFLSSAFASGPALLIVLTFIVRKYANYDVGKKAIDKLATIVTYAAIINLFFVGMEFFTAFYSNIPGHMHPLVYLFFGLEEHTNLVPFMWLSLIGSIVAILLLLTRNREKESTLVVACVILFVALWIDKGLGLVLGGFVPNPFEQVTEYTPRVNEIMVTLGVWATGFFILSGLYKVAVSVKQQPAASSKEA
ncbi:MAG: polysulfide reductase NrfD [Nitrospirota bacterium]|jgi:Ni/Fe-hydrogenase subunit HybB-like protein